MKYCTFLRPDGTEFAAFCLAPETHGDLAAAWRRNESLRVVSAGYCRFMSNGDVHTYGSSVTLNLKPRPTDAALIRTFYRAGLPAAAVPGFPVPGSESGNTKLKTRNPKPFVTSA